MRCWTEVRAYVPAYFPGSAPASPVVEAFPGLVAPNSRSSPCSQWLAALRLAPAESPHDHYKCQSPESTLYTLPIAALRFRAMRMRNILLLAQCIDFGRALLRRGSNAGRPVGQLAVGYRLLGRTYD